MCYLNDDPSSRLVTSRVSFFIRKHSAMSKRQNESNASVPSEGLIKRLKSAGGDVSRLEEFVESKDSSASVAAAFAVPLAGARSPSANESKLKVRLTRIKLQVQ